MSSFLQPETPEALVRILADAGRSKRTVQIQGLGTKRLLAGPITPASVEISTRALKRVIQYEPRDLTIGVEAGLPFAELSRKLAANGQMIPLEGAWSEDGTVGGLISANISGSRRRLYGTARDLVIGMQFATLDGKLVQSGGMVVKNVAGLDMAKMMIGSYGTLAAITRVNFKLVPIPAVSRTVLLHFDDLKAAGAAAQAATRGVLNPIAVDLLNPILSAGLNLKGHTVALLFGGNQAVIERSVRTAETLGKLHALSSEEDARFWAALRAITPRHMEKFHEGAVVRVSTTLSECVSALESAEHAAFAHIGSGIVRQWCARPEAASRWLTACLARGWKGVIECAGERAKTSLELWPLCGGDFAIMKQIKNMFDPEGLLNSGRLFGRL